MEHPSPLGDQVPPTGHPAERPWPPGDGELARRLRTFDWATTPLGPLVGWPPHLRTAIELMLASASPGAVHVGPAAILLYNDGWAELLGALHPATLGRSSLASFAEARASFEPILKRVWAGETVVLPEQYYPLQRGAGTGGGWFTLMHVPLRDALGRVAAMVVTATETTARRHAEAVLAATSARQAYLLRLADALRPLGDAVAIQAVATRLLGEHLGIARLFYGEVSPDGTTLHVTRNYVAPGVSPITGDFRIRDFGERLASTLEAGQPVVVPDVASAAELSPDERAAYAGLGIAALAGVPLIKDGRFVANLNAHQARPHTWTAEELALIEETAERTWAAVERTRAEAALHTSAVRARFLAALRDCLDDASDPETLLDRAVAALRDFLGVAVVIFQEIDPTGDRVIVHGAEHGGADRPTPQPLSATYAPAILTRLAGGEAVATADVQADPHTLDPVGLYRRLGVRAVLTMPLLSEGEWRGAFVLGDTRPRAWDDTVEFVRNVAERAWLAYERQRLLIGERAARQAAEVALQARDAFLSIAAHELRTPVTGIAGYLQLLAAQRARGRLDEPRLDRAIEMLRRAADRLVVLTTDLLDVTRLQQGQLDLALVPLDLAALVRAAAERWADRLDERYQLTLLVPEHAPAVGDSGRLEQVLDNLLDNALKYSPGGGPITLTLVAADDGWRLTVNDAGIGLPVGSAATIFTPFGRAANATARDLPGMGLGLHICRGIIERHGGRLWAESAGEGAGTTLLAWLPASGPLGRPV